MHNSISEAEFVDKAEKTIAELEKAYSRLAEDRDLDVEVEGGVLAVTFEEGEPGKYIVSPNSSARQVWLSARVSSFKFDWSEEKGTFVIAATGETIKDVMTRLTRQQLDDPDIAL